MKTAPVVLVLFLAFVFAGAAILAWAQPPPPPQSGPTYTDVAPIFQQSCVNCHSGKKPPKGLRLDSYENIINGDVITPGNPEKSDLFLKITGAKKPRMPRNGPPWLDEKKTATIAKWIAGGARL